MALAVILLSLALVPVSALAQERPLPPENPRACDRPDDNGGKVDLAWSGSPTPDVASYRVYRSEQPGGPYALLSERSTDSTVNFLGYVDTGLTDGVPYYYVVTAVDGGGRESERSPELIAVPEAQIFEAAVTVQKSMVISIAEQKLYCMENGSVVYVFSVSSGAGNTPTPLGNFKILYHDQAHPVPKYPGCVCYYWMGFFEDYAIHAWPTYNGVQSNYEGLGYPASHGCVRLDPTTAHIPFYWAPDGTPLSIIAGPFQAPPAPIQGGHVSRSVSEPATDWYFAEGYTGNGFDEFILVQNPQEQGALVDLELMLPDGSVQASTWTVGPKSRITIRVDDMPGMADTNVSARIRSDRPVVAERSMYFAYNGRTGGHDALGVTASSRDWYFAEGYTGGGFDEYILILNPNDADTPVHLDFMLPDGSVRTENCLVGAHGRATVLVDLIAGLEDTNVSLHLRSDLPVVAERSMYFGYNGVDGGHVSTGTPELSDTWYFAEGYTGGGFDEYILFLNPNDADASVSVDYMLPDGSVRNEVYTVGAHGRATVMVDAVAGLSDTDVSVFVQSSLPLIAERSMYFGYIGCPGGHVQIGRTEPDILHLLAEGYTSDFFDTYVLLMNPGDDLTAATITFSLPSGQQVTHGLLLGGKSRATVKVNSIAGLSNTEFSIRVDTGAPTVVERAMYFNFPR